MAAPFVEECLSVLTRTPATLDTLLRDLPESWTAATEGPGTWSPYVVIGHLIHGEKADWMPRLAIILEHGPSQPFDHSSGCSFEKRNCWRMPHFSCSNCVRVAGVSGNKYSLVLASRRIPIVPL